MVRDEIVERLRQGKKFFRQVSRSNDDDGGGGGGGGGGGEGLARLRLVEGCAAST